MSKDDNGGPAFPGEHFTGAYIYPQDGITPPTAITEPHQGMPLRDYFAAKALIGVLYMVAHGAHSPASSPEGCATEAYRLADAMLKARQS